MRRMSAWGLWLAAGVAIIVVISAAAAVIANAEGTAQVARDATIQHRAEAVLGAASGTRAAVAQALVVAEGREVGAFSEQTSRAARLEAETALAILRNRVAALEEAAGGRVPAVGQPHEELQGSAEQLLGLLEEGRVAEARVDAASAFATDYDRFVRAVADERDRREVEIAAVRLGVGQALDAARFLVVFLVPAGAMVGFWRLVRRQQERAEIEARLEREQGLHRDKDEFLASVAHELRTPLTAVCGLAEVLREARHDFNAAERDDLIQQVAEQAGEVSEVVEDLLASTRADLGRLTVQPEVLEVRSIIEKSTAAWGKKERARLTISGRAEAWADPLRVRQILRNLLKNALQHGGEHIELRISEGTPTVRIEVADDGPGIPEQDRQRIFEPYYRGAESLGQPVSLGLGLTVARKLARLMDGELSYRYRSGESVFELTLPAASYPDYGEDGRRPDTVLQPDGARPTIEMIRRAALGEPPRIVFQPVVDLATRQQVGFEALSRFRSGPPPAEWFAAAGESHLRLELELATIGEAVRQAAGLPEEAFLAVNVSDETLVSSRLVEAFESFPPERIILELSEEAAIRSYEATRRALEPLSSMGFRLALDDVGVTEMDLWHVVRLRPAILKLDVSLVRDLDAKPESRALVKGIAAVASDLEAMVVAEGVEREGEVHALVELGIAWAQGYHLGRPLPAPAAEPVEA